MAVFVELREKGGAPQRFELAGSEITIGRAADNQLALPKGNVSARHARLVLRDGRMILVDLRSTNGTFVNGRKITSPLVLHDTDKVYVGDFCLAFRVEPDDDDEPTAEVDVTELRLLANIAQRQEGSRMVYADWLEQHGDPVRAEFLRLQELVPTLEGSRFRATADRLRALAEHLELDWRRKVARPVIENCLSVELECPRDWGTLAATEHPAVRYCGSCQQRVVFCATLGEAQAHAQAGECIAVDVVPLRRPGDLEPPRPVMMGRMIARRDD